jgi:hypothetical protein
MLVFGSNYTQAYWFDFTTGSEMLADERANAIIERSEMKDEAAKDIDAFIENPANRLTIEQETRSHERMGKAEIGSRVTAVGLLSQKLTNPITQVNFPELPLVTKGVAGKYRVNETLFLQGDVNTFFTNRELLRVKDIIQARQQQKQIEQEALTDYILDGMFLGYN